MMYSRRHNSVLFTRRIICCLLIAAFACASCVPVSAVITASVPTTAAPANEEVTQNTLDDLSNEYEELEKKIQQSEQNLQVIEKGKQEQKKNISALQSQINDLDSQIGVLEGRIGVLESDISKLNNSISELSVEIDKLTQQTDETQTLLYETQRSIDLVSDKVYSRLLINYMSGAGSNLEFLVGATDLTSLYTRMQIVMNVSEYDAALIGQLDDSLVRLDELNKSLTSDLTQLKEKKADLSGEQDTLFTRQADIETSAYVLEMKKQLSAYKYGEATAYFKTLDKSSDDYAAMLKLFSDEQEKIDAQMNEYLLQYGSSADSATLQEGETEVEGTTVAQSTTESTTKTEYTTVAYVPATIGSQFTTTTTTTLPSVDSLVPPTQVNVVSANTDLMWPMPYSNCYISAYYGTYPSGGVHRGLDICVRGGTEGKNVIAAGSGTVIRYGFGHWSMGNYAIIDHGGGLFTAYYHLSALYVEQGDKVTQGQVIGLAGSTGNTTGPHLHFEVRVSKNGSVYHTNPLNWVSMP